MSAAGAPTPDAHRALGGGARHRPARPGPIVGVITAIMAGLHVWSTREITFLARNPADQYGYLANARWLSGDPHELLLPELAYYGFGYSLALVPVFWLFDDPEPLTRAILVVNALLMASLVPLLYLFCRRILDAKPFTAVAAAVVGATVPATFFDTSLALAENLVLPLSVASVLACWLYSTPGPLWQRVWFGPSIAALFATHERFTFVVVWALVVMAVAAGLRVVPARLAVGNITLTVALLAGTRLLRSVLLSTLWAGGELSTNQADRIPEYFKFFVNPTDFYRLLIELVGHAWYVAVGTLGIAALGVGFLVHQLRPRGRPRPSPFLRLPARLATVFLLGSGFVTLMTSSLYFSLNRFPSDGFIFGRYNEAYVPLWVAAGTTFVLTEPRARRLVRSTLALVLVIAGLTLALVAGRSPGDLDLFYTPFGVPDVARFAHPPGDLVAKATAVALGALALLAICGRYLRARHLLLVPLSVWLALGGMSQVTSDHRLGRWQLPDRVEALGVERVAVSTDRRTAPPPHYLFHLPDLHAVAWSPSRGEPPEPWVFHSLRSPELLVRGGRIALIDDRAGSPFHASFAVALWVLPGADQAELERHGKLLPAGFPTALPPAARRAELRLVGADATAHLRARTGGDLRLKIRGRHAGEGAPWPDASSFDRPGRVRVGARPKVAGANGVAPAPAYVELPSWTYPGEEFHVTLRLRAVDQQGERLPPGRYEYAVDMEQVGYGRFSPAGMEPLQISLEVTDR